MLFITNTHIATDAVAPTQAKKSKTPKPILKASSEAKVEDNAGKTVKKKSLTTTSKDFKKEVVKEKQLGVLKPVKKAVVAKSSNPTTTSAKHTIPAKDAQSKPEMELGGESDSGFEDEDKEMEGDSGSEVNDQTLALLQGFESDGEEEEEYNSEGYKEGDPVPVREKLSKKEEKRLKKVAMSTESEKPGVVYIGRVPHGFYENEMKAYFNQFGKILKIRLSRNKKTGASRHFGFIQFESATVADIVARTMDNYLMFNHLLKVKLVPEEQVNQDWFKGANKRFKAVPWNKMAGRKLEQGMSEDSWNERVGREEKRRRSKADKLKEIGYKFDVPKVKSATGIAKLRALEEGGKILVEEGSGS